MTATALATSEHGNEVALVRAFWEERVDDWAIATQRSGSKAFFQEIEAYRFEKLHYLPERVDFAGYSGASLLDVGCGLATDTSRFANGGANVTGIDIAPRAIELARENFAQRGLEGRFEVMNGEAMTFADNSFDVVYCHTVLHFTPDPAQMVQEIQRVLKPGGTAILMMINGRSWLYRMHKVANVKIDHLDAPVFHTYGMKQFEAMMAPFAETQIIMERFPVATKVHGGLKARLFNSVFVGVFNALPKAITRPLGHHMLAITTK